MTDYVYQQQTLTGEARQRASVIRIINPVNGAPTIIYEEERIAEVDGQVVQLPLILPINRPTPGRPQLGGQIDLASEIPLRDVATGELTGGSVPIALVYQALYSDYLNRAFARDNQASE